LGGDWQNTAEAAGSSQGARLTAEHLAKLAPGEAALVGAHSLVERAERLGDDDVVLMTFEDSRNGGGLCFGNRGDFFNDHTLCFALSASAARGQSHHPQRHDALRIDTKLGSFKRYLEPRVEQRTPFAEGSPPNESPHISVRHDLSNSFLLAG
jgi:hypothetical protein